MADLKILHLAHDEKFIDAAISDFERVAPGSNHLYVYSRRPIKYIKSPAKMPSIISILTGGVSKDLGGYDMAIIHSLNPVWYKTISRLPKEMPVVWIGWGYDYYDVIYGSRDKMLLPLTRMEIQENIPQKSPIEKLKDLIRRSLVPISKEKVIRRINFFSPVLPGEYELVRQKHPAGGFPDYCSWNYGEIEETLENDLKDARVTGRSILVGNSAFAENNHIDSFALLSELGVDDRRVVVPLSYGDARYRDLVMKKGRRLFGERFFPLVDFMPLMDYVKTLESCGFVIMNHLRQQAVSNIIIMLHIGAKVFLRKECPTYAFFREMGAVIFSVQELEQDPGLLENRLDQASTEINRDIVRKNFSKEVCQIKTINLLKQVCQSL
ncbi:TDP-N-acetylfucosamine:lipid II N-acetylfucosaminyltransferase [Pseudomonas sp. BN102]|uniref:TDP-N-acetylfucosamine:lipid II N-acetylfucosaminyltransferase n=1 Tax=Pseudomonas sp. BN102 TaxID=2567886 RepID=UPI002456ED1B|nr:TDP-N-acetylfucosamine:lipid II N-acetylfucosaminyltransferase [Pseudomonas sp. BN102]MDH4610291.1 4-alpha-L-fucosyltransferase (Fuc4NAc transferase) [Pseudomonas sp. BN102]